MVLTMSIEIWSNTSDVIGPVIFRRKFSEAVLIQKMIKIIKTDPKDVDLFAEDMDNPDERIVLIKEDGMVFREIPVQPEAGVFEYIPV